MTGGGMRRKRAVAGTGLHLDEQPSDYNDSNFRQALSALFIDQY